MTNISQSFMKCSALESQGKIKVSSSVSSNLIFNHSIIWYIPCTLWKKPLQQYKGHTEKWYYKTCEFHLTWLLVNQHLHMNSAMPCREGPPSHLCFNRERRKDRWSVKDPNWDQNRNRELSSDIWSSCWGQALTTDYVPKSYGSTWQIKGSDSVFQKVRQLYMSSPPLIC